MAAARYQLPPLILHPFTNAANSGEVLQAARDAAEKLVAGEGSDRQSRQLQLRLLAGRFAELRMLLFVGKDLFRWMEQCVDFVSRHPDLGRRGFVMQSFAELLVSRTPPDVDAKLRRWGVTDYARIFSRAIGIYAQFQEPPDEDTLQEDYVRSYYRYADYAYACWRDSAQFPVPAPEEFSLSLFASGEYSKLLEEQWRT